MSFAKPIFTTRGKQIELQGIEGQQIVFTKIKIGDGRITTQSPSQLTDLINVIAEAPITSLKRYDAYAAIRSVFQNIDVPEAFWWREVGLFATDPATGEDVLYAYQNAYDTAEYITPSSLVTKKINWTIYIDDGENLGADIHKKMVFCSVEDLDEHNDLEGAHEPAFIAHNADTGSHTDIRNKIGTDISSHNTSTSAHTDIRNKIQTVQQNASLFMLPVKRNTTYAVGDCASATGLPSWAYLECVTAGTTDEIEPVFGGGRVVDGTLVWKIKDIRCPYSLGDFVYKMNEPKDYEYLLLCDGSTISEENYPELVGVLGGTQLPNLIDRFLQGAATAGTYKKAGLPDITGSPSITNHYPNNGGGNVTTQSGAFYKRSHSNAMLEFYSSTYGGSEIAFAASQSNSIYGNSTTVQPPAYTTKIYICYL